MNENDIPERPRLDDNKPEDAAIIEQQIIQSTADQRFRKRARRGIIEYEPEDRL